MASIFLTSNVFFTETITAEFLSILNQYNLNPKTVIRRPIYSFSYTRKEKKTD